MPSSVIASMHYNPETKALHIVYVSGKVYLYKNVPQKVYDEMKTARSKGTFLNTRIKGKYEFEQEGD